MQILSEVRYMRLFKRIGAMLLALATVFAFAACERGGILNPVIYTDPIISELMADNSVTLADEYGNFPDWIEICNPTSGSVNLSGYGISDNPNQPFKYTLPDVTLNAGGYLIIFMDGENRVTDSGEIHGGFKIASDGSETVIFTSPSGKQLSVVAVGATKPDVSIGVIDGGSYAYFVTPTPGGKNFGTYSLTPDAAADPDGTASDGSEPSVRLLINEYMKKNTVLLDFDGDYSPWAELYNPGDAAVDIGGFYLSDDIGEINKYQFPEGTTVDAHGYLLVYLSGKDKLTENNELHASFKFGSSDTVLILSDKFQKTVDSITPVDLTTTLSYGRSETDESKWLYFSRPTPGKANMTVGFEDLSTGLVTAALDDVYISEVMSVNKSTYKNLGGEYVDWIELYNPADEAVDLSGWYISDDLEDPRFFELPSGTSIAAGGYMLLYAAGMATVNKKGEIYLPFSLKAEGETLILTNSDGVTRDVFSVGRLRNGQTSGRANNEAARVFFDFATPNAANSESGAVGYTFEPEFSADGGCIEESSVTVELSCKNENAVIYYTLDGTEPNEKSKQYTGAVTVSKSCVLRAAAKAEDRLMSDVVSRTYVFNESHDIPVFCISSDPDGLFSEKNGIYATGPNASSELPYHGANFWKDWERKATFEYYTEEGDLGITFNAGLKIFGQYSRAEPQKPFKIKLRGEYGTPQITYPFFKDYDVSTFKCFLLRQSGEDWYALKMRDAYFAQVIKGRMDLDYMEYRPVAVYINGEYWGLYNIREHIDADYIESHRGIDADSVDLIKGNRTVKAGSIDAYNEFYEWMKNHDLSIQENFDYAASKIDLESWMNWWITETFFSNTDTGNIKFYCEQGEDGKWRWILFDMDWAMHPTTYFRNRLDRMLDPKGHGAGKGFSTLFARRLMQNEAFKNEFIEAYAYHINNTFTQEHMFEVLDRMADEIRTEIPKQAARWGRPTVSGWEKQITQMKDLLIKRRELCKQHLQDTFDLSNARMKELFPDD